jgi:hypothetical protein
MGHGIFECLLLTGTWSAEGIMASGHVHRANRPEHMAAPTNAADVKKALANLSRPHMAHREAYCVVARTWSRAGKGDLAFFALNRRFHGCTASEGRRDFPAIRRRHISRSWGTNANHNMAGRRQLIERS